MRYGALFEKPNGDRFNVGPFDTESEAREYAESVSTEFITFTGETVGMMTANFFERYTVGEKFRVQGLARTPDGHWIGEVTRIGNVYGFIVGASRGTSWFYSKIDEDGHDPEALKLGTLVSFTGSPHPTDGNKYPRAYSIRVLGKDYGG
jgi:hypothetical protein